MRITTTNSNKYNVTINGIIEHDSGMFFVELYDEHTDSHYNCPICSSKNDTLGYNAYFIFRGMDINVREALNV